MKCPTCQAKLLPVSGQMFCLQCGNLYEPDGKVAENDMPDATETVDPLLQKAINDGREAPVQFRLPVAAASVKPPAARLAALRELVRPPREALHPALAAGAQVAADVAKVALAPPKAAGIQVPVAAGVGVGPPNLAPVAFPAVSRISLAVPVSWLTGGLVFLAFVVLNAGVAMMYSGKAYPGVRVGRVAVGGQARSVIESDVERTAALGPVTISAGNRAVQIQARGFAQVDTAATARLALAVGRDQPLPLVGVVKAWLSQPVAVQYKVDQQGLALAVQQVAEELDQPAHDAAVVVYRGRVLSMSEKEGVKVDQPALAEALRTNLGHSSEVTIRLVQQSASIRVNDYKSDIEQAQEQIDLHLSIKVKNAVYEPTAEQIASWLALRAPGKGVTVDGGRLREYVAGLSGVFDREATAVALEAALNAGRALDYVAATKKDVAVSGVAPAAAVAPVAYRYCIAAPSGAQEEQLGGVAREALAMAGGWSLGGLVTYERTDFGCDVNLSIRDEAGMTALAPACAKQTTCEADGQIAIAAAAWSAAPSEWKGSLTEYRRELVNHELGHWLGFDHASCFTNTNTPVLSEPDVTLGTGCSPKWYAIPVELQGTKVLAGF